MIILCFLFIFINLFLNFKFVFIYFFFFFFLLSFLTSSFLGSSSLIFDIFSAIAFNNNLSIINYIIKNNLLVFKFSWMTFPSLSLIWTITLPVFCQSFGWLLISNLHLSPNISLQTLKISLALGFSTHNSLFIFLPWTYFTPLSI